MEFTKGEKKSGVSKQVSVYNFCVWYTSSHNINFKELETSKAMFVGENHVLFEQLIKLEKAGGIQALHQVWNGDCRLQSFKALVRCVKWLDSVWAAAWTLATHKCPPRPHHLHPASSSHSSWNSSIPWLTCWKPHRGKGTTTLLWDELHGHWIDLFSGEKVFLGNSCCSLSTLGLNKKL